MQKIQQMGKNKFTVEERCEFLLAKAKQRWASLPPDAVIEKITDEELLYHMIWDDDLASRYGEEYRRRHPQEGPHPVISEDDWMAYRDELRRRHPRRETE